MKQQKSGCGFWTVAIVISAVIMISWFFYKINNATLYSFQYEAAQDIFSSDISYVTLEKPKNPPCDYPGCTKESEKDVHTNHLYTDDIFDEGMELLLKIPNKAQLQMCSDSFTYTEKNEHTVSDTNTYLIPQGDGRIKIETRTDNYVIHTDGATKTVNYIYFQGYYCSEHAETARHIWREEVEDVFVTNNAGYYFYKYGFWASVLLTPCLFGIMVVVRLLISSTKARKKGNSNVVTEK